jgi:hypothetical protein
MSLQKKLDINGAMHHTGYMETTNTNRTTNNREATMKTYRSYDRNGNPIKVTIPEPEAMTEEEMVELETAMENFETYGSTDGPWYDETAMLDGRA